MAFLSLSSFAPPLFFNIVVHSTSSILMLVSHIRTICLFFCLSLLVFSGCAVDDDPAPIVVTEESDSPIHIYNITPHSALISGLFVEDADSSMSVGIRLSMQNTKFITNIGSEISAVLNSDGTHSVQLDGLYSDTTYYFCTYYQDGANVSFSDIFSFRTHRLTAQTDSVSNVYAYGAQFNMTLSDSVNPAKFHGRYGMLYSTRPRAILEYSYECDSSLFVSDLSPGTTYYYRAFTMMKTADLREVYAYGATLSFVTPDIAVQTGQASNITVFSSSISGSVNVNFENVQEIGFLYWTRNRDVTLDSVGVASDQKIVKVMPNRFSSSGRGAFSALLDNLEPNTTYYFRAFMSMYTSKGGITSLKTFYGDVCSLTTNELVISSDPFVDLGLSVKWSSVNLNATSEVSLGTQSSFSNHDSLSFVSGSRLPSVAEAQELVDSCHWSWMSRKHVVGVAVTGPNGNSIFIPANMTTGSAYTWGAYMLDSSVERNSVKTIRFVKDELHDNQSGKTTDNEASLDAVLAIRPVANN